MNDMKQSLVGGGAAAGFRLFFSERDSDVSIRVEHEGGRWHFPAHQLVLCTMSEVFRTMLDADMIERRSKVITIKDTSPYAVKQFLRYIYMGIVEFNGWSEALNLLKVAHKYGVQTLINLCEAYLCTNIFFSNACDLFEVGKTYSLKSLKKSTKDFILQCGFIVSSTEGFFNLRSRSLECFISNPCFNMENEGTVLTCLREWAICECSRNCVPLTRMNVLAAMEPFLKYIDWDLIPENQRTFVPLKMVEDVRNCHAVNRKSFHFTPMLQFHVTYVKFIVELGTFHEQKTMEDCSITFVKFNIESHAFLSGFRIIGLFKSHLNYTSVPSYLILSSDDGKAFVQFNLNSLPWSTGNLVGGNSVWRELVAYLPYPIRIDPFNTYSIYLKSGTPNKLMRTVKWPRTRQDSESLSTNLGSIHLRAFGSTQGVTQLFLLPAPPYRNICNRDNDD